MAHSTKSWTSHESVVPADSDVRRTPAWVLAWLRQGLGLDLWLDVACDGAENAVCDTWIGKETDGLRVNWKNLQNIFLSRASIEGRGCWAWCNPPYSRGSIGQWIEKAQEEAEYGVQTVMLLPADLTTGWANRLMESVDVQTQPALLDLDFAEENLAPALRWLKHQTVFFRGRLKFDSYSTGARFGSMLVFIGGRVSTLPMVSVASAPALLGAYGAEDQE